MEQKWNDEEDDDSLPELSARERELLKDATSFQIKMYGSLDQETLEAMLVGYLVTDRAADGADPKTENADKILEAHLSKKMFENKNMGALFEDVQSYYKEHRRLLSVQDAAVICMNHGQTVNDAAVYKNILLDCKAAAVIRNINVELLIDGLINRFLMKEEDRIYKNAIDERMNPDIGPRKSWENMREACVRDLIDPRGGYQGSRLV